MPARRNALLLLLLGWVLHFGAGGCLDAGQEDDRSQWIRHALLAENRVLLERDPRQTGEKFLRMASDPYRYFRGTAQLFVLDTHTPGALVVPTRFGSAEGALVRLVGDPHPENLGSFRLPDGSLTVAWNDFDAATWGPWTHDLRRLATGLWVASVVAWPGAPAEEIERVVTSMVRGYTSHVRARAEGEALAPVRAGEGVIVDDLLRRARRDGDLREELDEYTRVVDGQRVMFFGEVEAPDGPWIGDLVVGVPPDEAVRLEAAIGDWQRRMALRVDPAWTTVRGMSRRYGAGISSYPVLRYYVLIEGPSADPVDDILLEFKEALDPLVFPHSPRLQDRPFATNGARIVDATRWLQQEADTDRWLGWGDTGGWSFRVRERTKYQKNFDVYRLRDRLVARTWIWADWVRFAGRAGELLAEAHTRAPILTGRPGLDVVAADLGEGADELLEEVIAFVRLAGPQTLDDHQRLQQAIANHGPLLGYPRPPRDR
jgi:uncharacterized protein (DUF2252 family)